MNPLRDRSDEMIARELLAFLCEDPADEAAAIIARWVSESRRFYDFVDNNRAKIRKKLRTAMTRENLRSVLLELEVARHFLGDRRCLVEYERYGQGRIRSPDLTVTFRARTVVNLEVTQVKAPGAETSEREGKLIGLICNKLGQMMPGSINVLVIAPDGGSLTIGDVARAMKLLKERVEKREVDLLSRFGFADASSFFRQFQWLSGIVVWKSQDHKMGAEKSLWVNLQARRPLPEAVSSLLVG